MFTESNFPAIERNLTLNRQAPVLFNRGDKSRFRHRLLIVVTTFFDGRRSVPDLDLDGSVLRLLPGGVQDLWQVAVAAEGRQFDVSEVLLQPRRDRRQRPLVSRPDLLERDVGAFHQEGDDAFADAGFSGERMVQFDVDMGQVRRLRSEDADDDVGGFVEHLREILEDVGGLPIGDDMVGRHVSDRIIILRQERGDRLALPLILVMETDIDVRVHRRFSFLDTINRNTACARMQASA